MKSAITSRIVFAARRRYLNHPTLKTAQAYDRLYKAYKNRFLNRELDFYAKRVRFILGLLFLFCFVSCAHAQQSWPLDVPRPYRADYTMDELLAARAKLIHRYAGKVARGVAICGSRDLLNGEVHSYLTVYVYLDSATDFALDFNGFATVTPDGTLGVDGVDVSFQIIQRKGL